MLCATLVLSGCASSDTPASQPTTETPTILLVAQPPATTQPTPTPTAEQVGYTGKMVKFGGAAVDFTLPDPSGNDVTLSDYSGKIVLLNFFATWCPPCNAELPGLIALYDEYQDQNLQVVAVSTGESRYTVQNFCDENEIPFTVLVDTTSNISRTYNARSIPRSFFISEEGTIEIDHVGYMSEEVLRGYIEQMLE